MSDLQSNRRIGRARSLIAVFVMACCGLVMPALCTAQSVSVSERDALVRLHVDRGGRPENVDALIRVADESAARGLPRTPLINKIREGLAKNAAPQRIEAVVRQMAVHLDAADRLVREADAAASPPERDSAVTLIAEALGSGVTPDEVRELNRQARAPGRPALSPEALASAAKGLSFIKDAMLPVPDGTSVIAEGVRQGFRPHQVLDLGREVKRRESDFRTGRASLRALRDAIARGERPEQLFRDSRIEAVERPAAATRPEPVTERPQRPARPEPQRPERPGTR